MNAIQVDSLVKKYKTSFSFKKLIKKGEITQEHMAINGLSFSVKTGEVYGLLGPNGAGKTTLIKILATILIPDGGDVEVLQCKLPLEEKKVKDRIGLSLGEYERTFHWRLSGRQNLDFFCSLFGVKKDITKDRIDEVLALVGLADKADTMFLEYSTGMKHKLALSRALLSDPELMLFDEPTAGLDLKTSRDIGALIRSLAKKDKTIIYSTHRIEEAGNLCDRVLIMDHGKKLAEEQPEKLKKFAEEVEVLQIQLEGPTEELLDKIRGLENIQRVYLLNPNTIRIHCRVVRETLYPILELIRVQGFQIQQINSSSPTMEDVFLRITGDIIE